MAELKFAGEVGITCTEGATARKEYDMVWYGWLQYGMEGFILQQKLRERV